MEPLESAPRQDGQFLAGAAWAEATSRVREAIRQNNFDMGRILVVVIVYILQ
ncbi:MAG: hypothetical protein ACI8W8_003564 [Rhodothermales bacterium]